MSDGKVLVSFLIGALLLGLSLFIAATTYIAHEEYKSGFSCGREHPEYATAYECKKGR
jgi:hypothetical protein